MKEQWGKLTDDRLDEIAGRREQLAGEMQQAYGITRDEADDP
ncbi:CsbD family protein [Marinobacter suaedae]